MGTVTFQLCLSIRTLLAVFCTSALCVNSPKDHPTMRMKVGLILPSPLDYHQQLQVLLQVITFSFLSTLLLSFFFTVLYHLSIASYLMVIFINVCVEHACATVIHRHDNLSHSRFLTPSQCQELCTITHK